MPDAQAGIVRNERLAQRFDLWAGHLDPSVALADVADVVRCTAVKERQSIGGHEFIDPRLALEGFVLERVLRELESDNVSGVEVFSLNVCTRSSEKA